ANDVQYLVLIVRNLRLFSCQSDNRNGAELNIVGLRTSMALQRLREVVRGNDHQVHFHSTMTTNAGGISRVRKNGLGFRMGHENIHGSKRISGRADEVDIAYC